jgi:hypothetical protein
VDLASQSLKRGANKVKISAKSSGSANIAATTTVAFVVTSQVTVSDIEFTRDGAYGKKSLAVSYPGTLGEQLDFDEQNHIIVKFSVTDKASKSVVSVHQAFIVFTNKQTGQQATFVAEQLSTKAYVADVNVGVDASAFNFASGDYDVTVLIGDDSAESPIEWALVCVFVFVWWKS